ncbi:MAG: P1 family peptidase [Gemmatimonadota bacterium]
MSSLRPFWRHVALVLACTVLVEPVTAQVPAPRRARDLGIAPGVLSPGRWNAITDVAGVRVGHATVRLGDSVRTGVTAILPHAGNVFFERVPAAIHVGNGFGKLLGVTQVAELGELETPIVLTCTLCVWKVADAFAEWLLAQPGMESVRSINPVVGETNDGYALNAIRSRPISPEDVRAALTNAASGPVAEGAVGAGTGTIAFEWKGGIGTSSRVVRAGDSTWTVGVLVQSNFGAAADLTMMGVPVGRLLARGGITRGAAPTGADGSIMIVVATDAPLSDRNLRRLAARAIIGIGRTGAVAENGSGDYVIAFSTAPAVRRGRDARRLAQVDLGNQEMSALFHGVVEATEEAVYNSLTMATTESANGNTVAAIPVDEIVALLRARQALRLPPP